MNTRAVLIAGGLFVAIVLGMFAFAQYKKSLIQKEPAPEVPVVEEEAMRIDAKHFFIDGTHTIAGEIMMPTPCDLLETSAIVRESMPEQVTIAFEVVNNSEMCAQVVTAQRFKVDFAASEHASIDATYKGKPAILNLIPAGPGESPEDFEVFIKG
jgi:hypothetical protein